MKKTAVFPGSFDPITTGHEAIINRSTQLFDKVIIAIGENSTKKHMFDIEQRKRWIKQTFPENPNIEIQAYSGLTVDFCLKNKANFIVRGLRSSLDFEYEQAIALTNKELAPSIETVMLFTESKYSMVSSSIVRDIITNKGNAEQFLPKSIQID
ncbi:MAG: pantetheine-phosphate adenylyltransferase [Flavobacteriales bacterium]|nr:pantetheine-phosphate adenylyltransferase [Flavobacteriales bacterium]